MHSQLSIDDFNDIFSDKTIQEMNNALLLMLAEYRDSNINHSEHNSGIANMKLIPIRNGNVINCLIEYFAEIKPSQEIEIWMTNVIIYDIADDFILDLYNKIKSKPNSSHFKPQKHE